MRHLLKKDDPAPRREGKGDESGLKGSGTPRTTGGLVRDSQAFTGGTSPSPLAAQRTEKDRMEEAYTRIIDLVASIREHLELQDKRAERMAPTLERLAEGLADIPSASKAQVDLLSRVGDLLESEVERTKNLEASLSQLPHIADAQRETMVSMGRQLDVLRESGDSGGYSGGSA